MIIQHPETRHVYLEENIMHHRLNYQTNVASHQLQVAVTQTQSKQMSNNWVELEFTDRLCQERGSIHHKVATTHPCRTYQTRAAA